jgi:HAD superfamily hydrolase (TIGR01484 family)
MTQTSNDRELPAPQLLVSDLDGTLIPLPQNSQNQTDLKTLAQSLQVNSTPLWFATGRHFDSAFEAIAEFGLPVPQWLIGEVGTGIWQQVGAGGRSQFERCDAYLEHLGSLCGVYGPEDARSVVSKVASLQLQEPENQGPYKVSYYTGSDSQAVLDGHTEAIRQGLKQAGLPFAVVSSIDHSKGGMIDLLPIGVSKAYAVQWLCEHLSLSAGTVVFAGDSGNDFEALTSGCRAIVVGGCSQGLYEKVLQAHQEQGWAGRLYAAKGKASSGVLEDCRHYGLL